MSSWTAEVKPRQMKSILASLSKSLVRRNDFTQGTEFGRNDDRWTFGFTFHREFDSDGSTFSELILFYTTFFKGKLNANVRYLFPFQFVEDMGAKRGIKKSDITHSKHDKIDSPTHQDYHERK
jgi:hypothetical protein